MQTAVYRDGVGDNARGTIEGQKFDAFFATLAGTLVFIVVHWLISFVSTRWPAISSLVKGNDTLLIKNGRANWRALRDAHMSSDDLAEDLREQGVEKPQEVKEARLERSGKLSALKKSNQR